MSDSRRFAYIAHRNLETEVLQIMVCEAK